MGYYQIQWKFLSTGRLLNVDTNEGNWIRNQSAAAPNTQIFNLRKVFEPNLFALQGEGKWIGFNTGYQGRDYLAAVFNLVEKDMALEIIPNLETELVRIKVWDGSYLKVYERNELGSPIQHVAHSNASLDDDDSVLSLMLIPSLETSNDKNVPNAVTLANIKPLDGIKAQFKSAFLRKYLCPKNGGGSLVAANSSAASNVETFKIWAIPGTNKYLFQVSGGQFMGLDGDLLVATTDKPGIPETFEIVQKNGNFISVRIKAANGRFLQAKTEDWVNATARESTPSAEKWSEWGEEDPSVFSISIVDVVIPDSTTIEAIESTGEKLEGQPPILPPEPCAGTVVKLGSWGGGGGYKWDVGDIYTSTILREIVIQHSDLINSFAYTYESNGRIFQCEQKGEDGGMKSKITLADGEYLTSVRGHHANGIVSSLTFGTSTSKTHGPYGKEEGTPFYVWMPNGKIIGFHGNAGRLLDSIGLYVVQNQAS